MLSLVAMTSVPIATLANADLTNTVNGVVNKMEPGDGLSIEDGVFVSAGSPVVIEIGKLVKGKYKLTAATKGDNVKLTVNGNELSDGEFSLSGETTVAIKAESTDGAGFQVGGFKLELVYDFKSAYTVLNTKLSGAYKKLSVSEPDFWELELLRRYNEVLAARIETVKDGSEDSYEAYKAEGLYEGINDSKIAKDINAFVQEVDNAIANKKAKGDADTKIADLRSSLSSLESALANSSNDEVKALFKEKVESISSSITAFEADVKTSYEAKSAATQYGKEVVDAKVKEIENEISEVQKSIETADANYGAYKEVNAGVLGAEADYQAATQALIAKLAEDQNPDKDIYANMLAEAQGDLLEQYNVIAEVKKLNGTDAPASTAAEKKDENLAKLTEVNKKVSEIKDRYITRHDALEKAYSGNMSYIKSTIEDGLAGIKKYPAEITDKHKDAIAEIEAGIADLKNIVNKAYEAYTVDGLGSNQEYTTKRGGFITKMNELVAASKPTIDNYDANKAVVASIEELTEKLAKANEEVAKCVDKKFNGATAWAKTTEERKKEIDAYTKAAGEAYNAGGSVKYQEEKAEAISATGEKIDTYKNEVSAAFGKYKDVVKAVADNNKALDAVRAFVGSDGAVTDGNGTPYSEKIAGIQSRIDGLQKELDEAMKKSDKELADALTGIDIDANIAESIAMIKETFEEDKEKYEGTINVDAAKQQLAYQLGRQAEIKDSLNNFSKKYTKDVLGKGFDDVDKKLKNIKSEFEEVQMPVESEDDITADRAGEIRVKLVEINNTFNTINTKISELTAEAEKVKAFVDANKAHKTDADKRVGDLNTKAEDIKTKNEDKSRGDYFADLYDDVITSINKQNAAIKKSYEDETLVADWSGSEESKGISVVLDEIEKKIEDYIRQAITSTENYEACNGQKQSLADAKFAEAIDEAKKAVKAIAPDVALGELSAGLRYYYFTVLDGYSDRAKTLEENIKKWYDERVSSSNTKGVNLEISELTAAISVVAQNARENEDAHTAQVKAKELTQAEWNRVFGLLSAEDKSTQLQVWLDQLNAIQLKINDLNGRVEEDYAVGKCKDTDFTVEYTELRKDVQNVEEQWKGNYDDAVIADNQARYRKFTDAIAAAKAEYDKDVISIAKFNSVRDEYFSDKISEILKANDSLYTYPEKIRKLTGEANEEYNNSNSEDLYDAKEENVAAANQLKSKIEAIYKKFTDKANEKANERYNNAIIDADQQLEDALKALAGYKDDVKDQAFSDIRKIITESKTKAKDNPELVLALDGILNELGKIETLVPVGQEAAAVAEYNAVMSELDKKIADEREELGKYPFAADLLTEYNKVVSTYIDGEDGAKAVGNAAIANKNMFGDNLAAVKKLIADFEDFYKNLKNNADSNKANLESWERMNEKLNELQVALDKVKTYAEGYYVDNPRIAEVQKKIDGKRSDAEGYKSLGLADEKEGTFIDECDKLKTDEIDKLYATVDDNEHAGLLNAVNELKSEYNKAVAAGGSEDLKEYENVIKGYGDELEEINGDKFEGDKHASFIALEKKIAVTRSELANVYDNQLAMNTYNSLIASIDEIKTKQASEVTDLEACNNAVKEAYAGVLAGILAKAEAAKEDVDADKAENTLLFYNDNRIKEIEAIAAELNGIAADIDKMQAPYTANDEAYARLTAELDKLQTAYESLKEKFAGYDYVELDKFEEAAKEDIVGKIAEDRQTVEEKHNATEVEQMLNELSQLENKQIVEMSLYFIDNNYSYHETSERISAVETAKNAVKDYVANGRFTEETRGSLQEQIKDIEESLTNLGIYNRNAFVCGAIGRDINGEPLVEDGKEIPSRNIDFVEEAVPAVFAKVEELTGTIDNLQTEAEENCYILGDVSRDGGVFADDYTMICNVVLEKDSFDEGSVEFLAADINEDGKVNVGDVSAVARIIRGMDNATARSYAKSYRAPSVVATVDDAISLTADGEGTRQRIAINLQNSKAYNACQMDIKLPSGLRIAGESLGERAEGMTLMSNELSNGSYRIMLSTLDDVEIAEGSGAIVYLDVEVGYSYSGEGIEVSDVLFADSKARLYNMGGIGANDATGIGTVTLGEAVKGKIYSVGGVLMNGLKRGVNIIRGNDGSTKKVIVK